MSKTNNEGGKNVKALNGIALLLIIVGGLNWLLVGLFDWNLVHAIFGGVPVIENIVYIVVGIAAIYAISFFAIVSSGNKRNRHTHTTV